MSNTKKYHKIAVLSGGLSKEREVSVASALKSVNALNSIGYEAYILDPAQEGWIEELISNRPDAVLNMLHGKYGEDGTIQGLLECLKIPYSHSGVEASSVAMNKHYTKQILSSYGLPVPKGFIASPKDIYQKLSEGALSLPVVIKPISEGSSVDMIITDKLEDLKFENMSASIQAYDNLMVEQFIPGRELTVSVFNDKAFTVTEITTTEPFYDYKAKYTVGGSKHILPAKIPQQDFDLVMNYAVKAHQILGCKGITRTDFRYWETEDTTHIYILEINTQPGMTPTSLVPEQAEHLNISYPELVALIVEDASCNR